MEPNTIQRRAFFSKVLSCAGGAFLIFMSYTGLRFVLSPLRRKKNASKAIRVASLDEMQADSPIRVVVRADRWDAYVHYPPGPIGSVWLMREDSDSVTPRVRCFQTKCPHLGCTVDYSSERGTFLCQCHVSEFARDGSRLEGPSPRGMDELPAEVSPPDANGKRWVEVEFAEFQTGIAQKRIIT